MRPHMNEFFEAESLVSFRLHLNWIASDILCSPNHNHGCPLSAFASQVALEKSTLAQKFERRFQEAK
jgi:AraC-like DNA-binding protein